VRRRQAGEWHAARRQARGMRWRSKVQACMFTQHPAARRKPPPSASTTAAAARLVHKIYSAKQRSCGLESTTCGATRTPPLCRRRCRLQSCKQGIVRRWRLQIWVWGGVRMAVGRVLKYIYKAVGRVLKYTCARGRAGRGSPCA
jgi:hypothetical protein